MSLLFRLAPERAQRHPQSLPVTQAVLILPNMTDEIVVSEEPEQDCEACSGGWGHQVDMTDGYECRFRCRVCREVMVIDAKDEDWCCDHRYVGEDLWRSEEYYGEHSCPLCGERGDHRSDCELLMGNEEEDTDSQVD